MILFNKKRNKSFKYKSTTKGFSLVEALIAVSIFSVSILAVVAVTSKGISNITNVKNRTIATYLAQEGVEYMRNLRDTYVLFDAGGPSAGWTSFNDKLTGGSCNGANGCYFDDRNVLWNDLSQPMTKLILSPCGNITCSTNPLLYNTITVSGKYNYVSGTNSPFSRKVVSSVVNGNETKVSVTVSWMQGTGTHSVTLTENLFNWSE